MKPYEHSKKRANKKRAVLLLALLILLTALAFAGYKYMNRNSAPTKPATEEAINYTPATEEEKAEADKRKEELANQQNQTPTPPGNQKTVTPIITDAGQYEDKVEVRAYIPGVLENGGKCTHTFKQGSAQVTRTVDAQAGPQTTQCEPIGIPVSEFPSRGTWVLTISYSSSSSTGTSEPQNVEVN